MMERIGRVIFKDREYHEEVRQDAIAYAERSKKMKDTCLYNKVVPIEVLKFFIDSYIATKRRQVKFISFVEIGVIVGNVANGPDLIDSIYDYIINEEKQGLPVCGSRKDMKEWFGVFVYVQKNNSDININSIW